MTSCWSASQGGLTVINGCALAIGPLTSRQIFRFSEEGLVNARFDYSYNNFRVTSMQAVINETPLPIDLYRYVDVSGRVEQFGKFSVIFYDLNQVSHVSWSVVGL